MDGGAGGLVRTRLSSEIPHPQRKYGEIDRDRASSAGPATAMQPLLGILPSVLPCVREQGNPCRRAGIPATRINLRKVEMFAPTLAAQLDPPEGDRSPSCSRMARHRGARHDPQSHRAEARGEDTARRLRTINRAAAERRSTADGTIPLSGSHSRSPRFCRERGGGSHLRNGNTNDGSGFVWLAAH